MLRLDANVETVNAIEHVIIPRTENTIKCMYGIDKGWIFWLIQARRYQLRA